jgi:hypothetical protein
MPSALAMRLLRVQGAERPLLAQLEGRLDGMRGRSGGVTGCRSGIEVAKERGAGDCHSLGWCVVFKGNHSRGTGFAVGRFAEPHGRLARTTTVSGCLRCVVTPKPAGR